MELDWDDARLLLAVAETGSVTAAARTLRVGQPTVSRRLAALEHRVGHVLFERRATGVRPTAAAEPLLEPARKMAEWAGELARRAAGADLQPRGIVRIAAPPGVAFDFLAPFAAWLRELEPHVHLEVRAGIDYVDLARGEADLALRLRPAPAGGDLVTVASVRHAVRVLAAPGYAKKVGPAPDPRHLDWIAWAPPWQDLPPNPQLAALIPDWRPVFTSDAYVVQLAAAEAGVGAMVTGLQRHRFVRQGRLVDLGVDLGAYGEAELHLVCARSALDVARVRRVARRLAEAMAEAPVA